MADLTALLLAAQDPNQRAAAEQQLTAAEQKDVAEYFSALARELADSQKPLLARQLSGLLLKNGLWGKSADRDRELKTRYASIPEGVRNNIKENVVGGLGAGDMNVAKSAAQVLAKIGAIEVPANQWPQLIPLLLNNVTGAGDANAKQIALTTLGYLCEELVPLQLQEQGQPPVADEQCNQILTAVVQGMREPDAKVKLEATRAFYHAIVLAQKNFRNERERNFIMQVVHDTCKCDAQIVQISAFECLVQIATEFYDFLTPYMNAVGPLTWETIKSAPENVAIPAMEFWSTICDEELYLNELAASGGRMERQSQNLIRQAVKFLVPLLTECLTRRESEDDDDTWNLAMAAGTCLGLVAQVVGNDCVDEVLQFVQLNFSNPNWKYREAGLLAYGSIMEGPSSEKMAPLVQESFPNLVNTLQDQSIAVRDTVAWTIGRIAQFHPSVVTVLIKPLMPVLLEKLKDSPRVAANICWVISVLSEQQMPSTGFGAFQEMTPLSEFFTVTAQALLQTASRADAQEKQLGMKAYNALSALVLHSGNDCLGHMEQLVEEILLRLKNSFGCLDKECELQGLLCGVLQTLTQRLKGKIAVGAAALMQEYLKVFEAYRQVKGGAPVIHEEALLAVSALANAVDMGFEQFMPHFVPFLHMGLQGVEDTTVCLMSVGVVTDLCRALQIKILPYVEQFVQILYTNLQNPKVDRKIKAAIMTTFGDIALAITGEFEKFLGPVIGMLSEASATKLEDGNVDNEDWIDYLNQLREGVLVTYAGIIHGLRESGKIGLFKEHVNTVLDFVRRIVDDQSASEDVMKQAVCVVGDLIMVFQTELTAYLANAPFLPKLVKWASESQDQDVRKTSQWLLNLLSQYRPQ